MISTEAEYTDVLEIVGFPIWEFTTNESGGITIVSPEILLGNSKFETTLSKSSKCETTITENSKFETTLTKNSIFEDS